eukprot:13408229-Alexandrium_andersonii.AAC.1
MAERVVQCMPDELNSSQLAIVDEFEAKLRELESALNPTKEVEAGVGGNCRASVAGQAVAESGFGGSQVGAAEKVVQNTLDQLDKDHVAEKKEFQAKEAEQT